MTETIADKITSFAGTWFFMWIYNGTFVLWLALNLLRCFYHWDPYPFNLCTLALSHLAIVLSIIILISQKRIDKLDRQTLDQILKYSEEAATQKSR